MLEAEKLDLENEIADWVSKEDVAKFNRWLGMILTFKHLAKQEVLWYCRELSRRFSFPYDTLVEVFKREGML